jgi:hypothetical protein
MSERVVAVLARPSASLPAALASALLEDVIDLVADTPLVDPALVVALGYDVALRSLTWPGTPVIALAADPTIAAVLRAIPTHEAVAVAVLAPDVPDLPTLLLGKLFSALAGLRGAAVAVCPATAGGLVAVAANLPVAQWLAECEARLDDIDALETIRRAAPPRALSTGPGWRRVRAAADVVHLDPGLEGWDATRAYLQSEVASPFLTGL